MSPNFLFRIERDPSVCCPRLSAVARSAKVRRSRRRTRIRSATTSWRRGSRTSCGAACRTTSCSAWPEQKRLHDPAVLARAGAADAAGSETSALVENFGEQWLNLRLMDRTKPDSEKFLSVDDELLDAMRQETRLFIGRSCSENRSILDFIDGRFTFVNGPLARYYGIKGVDGERSSASSSMASSAAAS